MAKLEIRTDANGVIASMAIPNAVIPYAQQVEGGATNAETAALALLWMWRDYVRHLRVEVRRQASEEQAHVVTDAGNAAEATFDAAIPPV